MKQLSCESSDKDKCDHLSGFSKYPKNIQKMDSLPKTSPIAEFSG